MISSNKFVLKCLQINLRRAKDSTAALCQYIEDQELDLVLAQEPYVINNKVMGFPMRYTLIYDQNCDPNKVIKTVIILVNKNINCLKIQTFNTNILNTITLDLIQFKITIFNAYCSPVQDIELELKHIQSAIETLDLRSYLITMDSNSHSEVWYDRRNDIRGETVIDFMTKNNLILLNNNNTSPTFDNIRGQSSIDLTLVSENASNFLHNWELLEEETLSDHKYIYFEIKQRVMCNTFRSTVKYNTIKADWDQFNDLLRPKIQRIEQMLCSADREYKINNLIEKLIYEVTKACDQSIPKARTEFKHKSNKWWTRELSDQRSVINRLRRRYQRCRSESRELFKNEYLVQKIVYKNLINETKLKSWQRFVTDSTRENPWGLIYKISRNATIKDITTELKKTNGDIISDRKTSGEYLMDVLFPNDRPELDSSYHKRVRDIAKSSVDTEEDIKFTTLEVTTVVNKQNKLRAPGADGITSDIIQKINNNNKTFLTKLYNKCLELNYFPELWRTSIVKVIPKAGKTDYTTPGAYRPISLISVFAKIFEKLLINRINYFLKSKNLLNGNQFGFTEQSGTEQALHRTIEFIKRGYTRKGFTIVVSFDISNAFNTCWWPKILTQLVAKKCPKNLFNTVRSYFSNRRAKLWYSGLEIEREVTLGCPQGSASGPGFWNIAYDDIFDLNIEESVEIIGFADDTNLLVYDKTIEGLEHKVNDRLRAIEIWAQNNKLDFNASKTQCVLFTKNQSFIEPKLVFKGQELKIEKSMKYLGIIIDSKLIWKEYINSVCSKSTEILMKLLRFSKSKFGLNSRALDIIYKGAILPIIGYGCSVWIEAVEKRYIKDYLDSIQRRCALRL
jgi:hypothetical protein